MINLIYQKIVRQLISLSIRDKEYIFGIAFKYIKPNPSEEEILNIFHVIEKYEKCLPLIHNIKSRCLRELVFPGENCQTHMSYPFDMDSDIIDCDYIIEGFITDHGRFLNRKEARQLKEDNDNINHTDEILLSEEVNGLKRYDPLYDLIEN